LIYEAFNWRHGVLIGAALRSETTAAAEHSGKVIMHDPFAMRPFFGYNFGHYVQHWLNFEKKRNLKLPKIFHVNWFRKSESDNEFLWKGFGENNRVLDWICRRVDGEDIAKETPIGYIPKENSLNLDGYNETFDFEQLFSIPTDFWLEECDRIKIYFTEQVGSDLPDEMWNQLQQLKSRLEERRK